MPEFSVLQVARADVIGDEPLGSKYKFWFSREGEEWLFKEPREATGEDWAEKVAFEAAGFLRVEAAIVELAEFEGRRGSASLSFVHRVQGEALVHGNEILAGMVLGYERDKRFRQSDHTLENIANAVRKLIPSEELQQTVLTTLAGYLVLDALIGNTDRHHENWALLLRANKSDGGVNLFLKVAPSFDHASSLGRELQDARRVHLLRAGQVGAYVRNGRGAIYLSPSDAHGANPLRLVEFGARSFPEYFLPTLRRLSTFAPDDLKAILDRIPPTRISDATKAFTGAFLAYTYDALRALIK